MADDIRRYLDGQPVTAVQSTWLYVARKFVRRNRLAVSAAAMLFAVARSRTRGHAMAGAHRATGARQRRAAFQRCTQAGQLLLFDLYDSVGKDSRHHAVQADMAGRTLEYLDRLAAIKNNDPALRLELGQGYLRLGTVFGRKLGLGDSLGNNAKAIEIDRKALGMVEPVVREHPDDVADRGLSRPSKNSSGARFRRPDNTAKRSNGCKKQRRLSIKLPQRILTIYGACRMPAARGRLTASSPAKKAGTSRSTPMLPSPI